MPPDCSFAIAGKLRRDSLPRLANVPADVIAIRSAACVESDRTSELDATSSPNSDKNFDAFGH